MIRDDKNTKVGHDGTTYTYIVSGPAGALTFRVFDQREQGITCNFGQHASLPQYRDHTSQKGCEFLGGADCFFSYHLTTEHDLFRRLCEGGPDAVFEELRNMYNMLEESFNRTQATREGADATG